MNVFATVKTSINTREAAARYGVEVNHHGKALCPFHNDRHPSLFVDDDHYHCYACGEHGDVIDFTSKLYGLSMLDAAKKLAYDFDITLLYKVFAPLFPKSGRSHACGRNASPPPKT